MADVTVRAPIARWFTATICFAFLALLFTSAPFASAQPAASSSPFGTNIVARGKGVLVRQRDVDDLVIRFRITRTALGQTIPESVQKQVEADLLEKLIVFQLCEARVSDADKADAAKRTDQIIDTQRRQVGSEAAFQRQLQALAVTPEAFRLQLIQQAIFELVIARELRPTLVVTPEEERAYFANNPALFTLPERIRFADVFLTTRDATNGQPLDPDEIGAKLRTAQSVQTRAKAGEGFAKLVQEFTDATASKARNGEFILARAKDEPAQAMPIEFENAAFALTTNQISDVIVTDSGYHIVKLIEKLPVSKVEFSMAASSIRERLLDEKMQKAIPGFVSKLKQEAGVEILVGR